MNFLHLHRFIRNAAEWKSQKAKVWKKRAVGSFLRLCLVGKSPAKFTHCGFQHWLNAELTSIGVRKEESTYFM